jgi:LuxR family transcriptional regulator, maltose regulon positive regulatory protein
MSVGIEVTGADPLEAGHEALRRGEWEQARAHFEAALAGGETADAIEALAMAAWWLDDGQVVIESREHAYRLFREQGEDLAAARMAIWLTWDYLAFRGEAAVANGWLQRAHRLIDGLDAAPEHGWLAIREAEIAYLLENDLVSAQRLAHQALDIGRAIGDADVELSALALEGMALTSDGSVAEGIRMLDEASAAAVAGEISQLWAVGRACCYTITACERVRDFERAAQWSTRMIEFGERWRIPHLFAVCRAHYGAVLVSRGTWAEAEVEFEAAMRTFRECRPGMGFEAVVRLAELRRRQGRLAEATELFRQVEFHPVARLGLAAVAIDGGDPALAVELAERFLRQLGAENRIQRLAGLELLARALVELSEGDRAKAAVGELRELAEELGTESLRASALAAEGAVAAATGEPEAACRCYEDAVDLFQRNGAPFETALARTELARVLSALGRTEAAERQARAADEAMRAMRAAGDQGPVTDLTAREVEVLRLVADGLTNPAIAERLVISEHTVHRHLANILTKLGLSSRAAAAAWAAQRGLV